mmetsp:Transcript_48819/g.59075  ORF Transcript_48819/g.59075 Transcript_48819/m.59075 type:complete len:198 (+) Transcript_48819:399-992(+)
MSRFLLTSALLIFAFFGSQAGAHTQGLRNATSKDTRVSLRSNARWDKMLSYFSILASRRLTMVTVSGGEDVVAMVTPSGDIEIQLDTGNGTGMVAPITPSGAGTTFKSVSITGNSKFLWGVNTDGDTLYSDMTSPGLVWKEFGSSIAMQQIAATDDEVVVMALGNDDQVYLSSTGTVFKNWRRTGRLYTKMRSISIT